MRKFLWLLILLSAATSMHAFGKNKVVYQTYDWKVLDTEHFKIYLSESALAQSDQISGMAEEIFVHHSRAFNYVPDQKIRVVLYDNQIDFQQNNIVDWIGPGTGGFTEFVKGRVVVPYSPYYPDFRHVLSHELNHAFQGLLWGNGKFSLSMLRDIQVPLWMIEGAAEYNSIGVDSECETVIADGLINGVLPSLMKLTYLGQLENYEYYYIYKEGQMFYGFIGEKYGDKIFEKLNKNIAEFRELDIILSNTFQKSLPELNAEFFDYIRRKYYPEITRLSSVELKAKKVIREDSFFNMNPVSLPSNRVAFISDRDYYPAIMIYDRDRDSTEKVLRGGFDEEFLEFQYGKRNHLSVSTNGLLCFVSRSGGQDVIHLYDLNNRRVSRVELPYHVIYSPDISPDGGSIVFAAEADQRMGIYLYDIGKKRTSPLIVDNFFNSQPRFAGSNRIVLVSNRRKGVKSGDLDIYSYDVAAKRFEWLLDTGASDEFPAVSDDGNRIAFIRQDAHPALMVFDRKQKILYEEMVPEGGVSAPAFNKNGGVYLTAYRKNSYNLYEYFPQYKKRPANFVFLENWKEDQTIPWNSRPSNRVTRYYPEVSVDNLFGGFMINSSLGVAVLGMLRFSDLLGDDRYQLLMDSAIAVSDNFLDYVNVDFSYMNYRYRHNFGFRVFHYSNYFYEFTTFQEFFNMEPVYHSTYGVSGIYSFPFTTFDRIEADIGYRAFSYATNVQFNGSNFTYGLSNSSKPALSLAYVHDSTLWDVTGPVDGIRYEIILSKSFPLFTDSVNYEKIIMDFRSYFLLFPGYSIALRGVAGKVLDTDKDSSPFTIGGYNSVRGYDLWSFSGDTMFLFNLEFRVPFISEWSLGFPLPIRLPTVWGAIFWDFGSAWNLDRPYEFWRVDNNVFHFVDLKSGLGFGFRLVLVPGIKVMVDIATPFDGATIPSLSLWRTFWFIGIDF